MGDMLIRDVPEEVHAELKRRAEAAGTSLQSYARRILLAEAARPSLDDWFRQLDALPPVRTSMTGAEAVQAARDELL